MIRIVCAHLWPYLPYTCVTPFDRVTTFHIRNAMSCTTLMFTYCAFAAQKKSSFEIEGRVVERKLLESAEEGIGEGGGQGGDGDGGGGDGDGGGDGGRSSG
jgi:uncharacterized membrane protein YgcG